MKIEDLKAEKLKAEGREELDPLSEESTLKAIEIQKAERSMERLKRKAERRYQAGEWFSLVRHLHKHNDFEMSFGIYEPKDCPQDSQLGV